MRAKTISHYEILEPLGEGAMGTVYHAVDTRLGRPVAIKLLRAEGPGDRESRKRFIQEARAASALSHPHIITIYDVGQDAGIDFIAMEYVRGQSLAVLIGRGGLNVGDALRYAAQVADALASAHAAGIVHRDLKPSNIVVSETGAIKVVDFGLAKLIESARARAIDADDLTATGDSRQALETEEGAILGTAAYMSPEQAEGRRADTRSDVFSFGVVLYEMITGRRAFQGATKLATLTAVVASEPEPVGRLVPDLRPDLEGIISRCLRKSPERRWQSMADVKLALDELLEGRNPGSPVGPGPTKPLWRLTPLTMWLLAASALGIGAIATGAWWRFTWRPAGPPAPLMRLTSDVGWTDDPAISPDGKLVAYASDRGGEGNLDIWIQQVSGGPPVRLTHNPADDVDPSFSADGSRIAFQSSRSGGGIYVVPTLGGDERLLAERGFTPRFSPDGRWVAYGVVEPPGSRIYVAPAAGGPARYMTAGFYLALAPVWSPDGSGLLFWGQRDRDGPPEGNVDWWVAPIAGGPPLNTGARSALRQEGFRAFQRLPTADAWVSSGNSILFHGQVGDSSNIWQVAIAAGGSHVIGAAERVTFGTTNESAASVTPGGRLVFSSRSISANIWSLLVDADRGSVQGPLTRLTQDLADDYDPTLSADGRLLAFRSRRTGQFDVFLKNLATGHESQLTQTPEDEYPAISPDGTKVAYSLQQNGSTPMFVVGTSGGSPELICRECGQVSEWAPDGRRIVFVTGEDRSAVGLLTLGDTSKPAWLEHPGYGLFHARISPDGAWVSFCARANRLAPARVFVARLGSSTVAGEKEWIVVTEDGEAPTWSPDGNLLYFWSNRDGSPCLWAQRLDRTTRRPTGVPLAIQHFHNRGLSWRNLYPGSPNIAVAPGRIVFNLGEHTGSIWMTQVPPLQGRSTR